MKNIHASDLEMCLQGFSFWPLKTSHNLWSTPKIIGSFLWLRWIHTSSMEIIHYSYLEICFLHAKHHKQTHMCNAHTCNCDCKDSLSLQQGIKKHFPLSFWTDCIYLEQLVTTINFRNALSFDERAVTQPIRLHCYKLIGGLMKDVTI